MSPKTKKILLIAAAIILALNVLPIVYLFLDTRAMREASSLVGLLFKLLMLPFFGALLAYILGAPAIFKACSGPVEARYQKTDEGDGRIRFDITPARATNRALKLCAIGFMVLAPLITFVIYLVLIPLPVLLFAAPDARRRMPSTLRISNDALSVGGRELPVSDIAELRIDNASAPAHEANAYSRSMASQVGYLMHNRKIARNFRLRIRLNSGSELIPIAQGLTMPCAEALRDDLSTILFAPARGA